MVTGATLSFPTNALKVCGVSVVSTSSPRVTAVMRAPGGSSASAAGLPGRTLEIISRASSLASSSVTP